jgi:hypothetical protein
VAQVIAELTLGQLLRLVAVGFLGIMGLNALSNVIGSITGHNPMAQTTATMVQAIVPMMVSLMPVMMVMNMMMSMMNAIMAPFAQLARPMVPTATFGL